MFRLAVVTCILLLAIVANTYPSSPGPDLNRAALQEFPRKIGEWVSVQDHKIDSSTMAVLQVDDYIERTYVNGKGDAIDLYLGYFKVQREGKTNHSPRQCLPGSGWTPVETGFVNIPVNGPASGHLEINRYVMAKDDKKELFLFWYHGRGRQIAGEYMNRFYLVWDSISRHRTDGALVRTSAKVTSDPDRALKSEEEFIDSFYPLLSKFVPD